MTEDGTAPPRRPDLSSWAAVDPARHPFDPDGASAAVRAVAPPVPQPVPPGRRLSSAEFPHARREAYQWYFGMCLALAERYGAWAFDWCWAPEAGAYQRGQADRFDGFEPVRRPADETLRLVADELVLWRRFLEGVAEQFDRLLPPLRRDASAGEPTAAGWEAAITHLVLTSAGHGDDSYAGAGWCRRVLTWFLSAAGVPERHGAELVGAALEAYGHDSLSAADVADIAERLARQLTEPAAGGLARAGDAADDWPDTWPRGWPSWRATNLPRMRGPKAPRQSSTRAGGPG